MLSIVEASRRSKERGNVFFSPISIEFALAIAYEGAKGKTKPKPRRSSLENSVEPFFAMIPIWGELYRGLWQ